jgi:superfamily II DNA/RNA helicase
MTSRDWLIAREENDIIVKGKAPPPILKWTDLALPQSLVKALADINYETPTPIQM